MKKYFVNVICTHQSQSMGWGWGTAQYSETLQISVRLLFFSSGYLSSHACKWGPWLWKFHALPHCSVLLGIRADTGKQEHVSLRETCVASVRKTQTLLRQLIFSPQIHMKNAQWCVVFACFFLCYNHIESVETAELNRLTSVLCLLCFLVWLKVDIENYCSTCLSWDLLSPDIAKKEALM